MHRSPLVAAHPRGDHDLEKQHHSSKELCVARWRVRRWTPLLLGCCVLLVLGLVLLSRPSSGRGAEVDDAAPTSYTEAVALARSTAAESTRAADAAADAAAALAKSLAGAKALAEDAAATAQVAAHKKRVADRAAAAVAMTGQRAAAMVHDRTVRLDNGREVTFSIFGRGDDDSDVSVFVLPFDSSTRRFVLVEEYHPGPDAKLVGLIAGMVERKHASVEEAARWELSEEARLTFGPASRLVPLAPSARRGYPQDKYSSARFYPYLALDCVPDEKPRPRDDEERISISHVSEVELRALLRSGRMNTPSMGFALLALDWLEAQGESTGAPHGQLEPTGTGERDRGADEAQGGTWGGELPSERPTSDEGDQVEQAGLRDIPLDDLETT
jgi:8-oxo-dGTP pyrophosphatase MutT (NUDIX family)